MAYDLASLALLMPMFSAIAALHVGAVAKILNSARSG